MLNLIFVLIRYAYFHWSKLLLPVICILITGCSKKASEEEVALNLVTQVPSAEKLFTHFDINLGSEKAREYLGIGWSHDEGTGSNSWVWANARDAKVMLWLLKNSTHDSYHLQFRAWPVTYVDSEQTAAISVNGTEVGQVVFARKTSDYEITIPTSALHNGKNTVLFRFGFNAAPSSHIPNSRDQRTLAAAFRSISLGPIVENGSPQVILNDLFEIKGQEIHQPAETLIKFSVNVPANSHLVTKVGWYADQGNSIVKIQVTEPNGNTSELYADNPKAGEFQSVDVDLDRYEGKFVYIEFLNGSSSSSVIWQNPVVMAPPGIPSPICMNLPCSAERNINTDVNVPYLAPGLKYETLFEGGTFVAFDTYKDSIFVGDKQTGVIQIYRNGKLVDKPVVDFEVDGYNERGLLGIALHPEYPIKPFLYAYYSATANPGQGDSYQTGVTPGGNRLVRLTLQNGVAIDEQLLHDYTVGELGYHNGGTLRFDSEDALWLGIGDTLKMALVQDLSKPQGKLHRYNDDGTAFSANIFALDQKTETLDSVYAYGLRNPWNFAFHPKKGTIYSVDIGEQISDELNVIEEGKNYGWPEVEGRADGWREIEFARKTPEYRNPIWESGLHSTCPSGIAIAMGQLGLARHIVWSDCNRPWRIQVAELNGTNDQYIGTEPVDLIRMKGRPVNMMWASDGSLLVATMNADEYEAKGSIRRLSVVNPEVFQNYLYSLDPEGLSKMDGELWENFGRRVYEESGCIDCHSTTGEGRSGPSFKGIFETEREMEDGSKVLVNHAYIVESITNPQVRLVKGYPAMIPGYSGKLNDHQILGISYFIKSLR